MSKGIELHPTLGVNPRLTVCPRCGGDGPELMLLGRRNHKFSCKQCGTTSYSARKCLRCAADGRYPYDGIAVELEASERVPGSLCASCEQEAAGHKAIVEAGGIYWQCESCKQSGVIRPSPFTEMVRAAAGIAAPNPVGARFTKADCPVCGPHKV